MPIILDASIAIKWYIHENLSDIALDLKKIIDEGDLSVGVPQVFFLETANALWKKTSLMNELEIHDAKDIYSRLLDTSFHIVPDDDILLKALDIALGHAISIYDAMYLASALFLNSTLVTADAVLVKRLVGSNLSKHICFLEKFK